MTISGLHHLPAPDDSVLQRLLDDLSDSKHFDLTPGRKTVLAALHEFGWLAGQDGVAGMMRDLIEREARETKAAASRRLVRAHRAEQEAERRFHASQPHPRQTRAWSLIDGGFRCHLCNTDFLRYIDPAQAVSAAQDHTQQCPGGGTDE